MKFIYYLIFCFPYLLASCADGDISIDDFESGTYDNWKVEGEAFGSKPATASYPGQQEIKGFTGTYFANSYNGGDDSRGVLLSKEITIKRDYINFLLGGGKIDTYIELVIDGKNMFQTSPTVESTTLQWFTWDVKSYLGKQATIRIVDNHRGSWGHILVDQIEMSNKKKSTFLTNYTLSFDIKSKFLLIPVEDKASESQIQLSVNEIPKGPVLNIRIAQKNIDYWVPINVEQYRGQKVTLTLAQVQKEDLGFSKIRASERFDFEYNEKYRPSFHFSPQYGWMNDPNGMVYLDGTYHLFYQYNPYGAMWGNMNWGHAVSKDLITWEHLPVAIAPDSLGAIFSGSTVIDKNNTAGFGENAMVAIYTAAGQTQKQSIAYSTDKGQTFTKYAQNPVLSDPNMVDFRDPKVFWHQDSKKWIMSLATSQTISFYGSKNLKEWTKMSTFGTGIGGHGGVWECPDLFPLTYKGETKWVLLVSINPGGPNGGSATQYFIGDFDGNHFTADPLPYPLWVDYGRDNYAGVTWNNVPEKENRRLFMGWMSNWDYANHVPTVHFRSAMTLPRELKLAHTGKNLIVASVPIEETKELRGEKSVLTNAHLSKGKQLKKHIQGDLKTFEIEMTIKNITGSTFGFKLQNDKNESLRFTFDLNKQRFSVDRKESRLKIFHANFASINTAPLIKRESYQIRLFIDNASSECFINNGELVSTNLIFPSEPYNSIEFDSLDGDISIENTTVYKLK